MALPKVNETLNFSTRIPSTNKLVKYRPYLVKEEKVLLQAFESENLKIILEAMCDTIDACLDPSSKIGVQDLTTFDVEYLFTQLRSSSVGENSTILLKCKKCETDNSVVIDLTEIKVDVAEVENVIEVTPEISVEMKYPSYQSLIDEDVENLDDGDAEQVINMIASSLVAVLTEEERIDIVKDSSTEEVKEFLNSLTATQFQKLANFLQSMPALEHDVEFKCESCNTKNEVQLRGLSDFF